MIGGGCGVRDREGMCIVVVSESQGSLEEEREREGERGGG